MVRIGGTGTSASYMYDGAGNYYWFNNCGYTAQWSIFTLRSKPSA